MLIRLSFLAFALLPALSRGLILTRDETLSGARWYGANPDDSKLKYRFSESSLIVQDTGNGVVLNEQAFSMGQILE